LNFRKLFHFHNLLRGMIVHRHIKEFEWISRVLLMRNFCRFCWHNWTKPPPWSVKPPWQKIYIAHISKLILLMFLVFLDRDSVNFECFPQQLWASAWRVISEKRAGCSLTRRLICVMWCRWLWYLYHLGGSSREVLCDLRIVVLCLLINPADDLIHLHRTYFAK